MISISTATCELDKILCPYVPQVPCVCNGTMYWLHRNMVCVVWHRACQVLNRSYKRSYIGCLKESLGQMSLGKPDTVPDLRKPLLPVSAIGKYCDNNFCGMEKKTWGLSGGLYPLTIKIFNKINIFSLPVI